MTQEEKAKAYDEALERAKKELGTCGSQDCDAARQIFRLFPELKESEDEKIRKEIISALKFANVKGVYNKHLAWLEKQCNTPKEVTCTQEVEVGNGNIKALVTEKIPIDKVEPKFKAGNWYQCTKDFFGKGVTFDKNTAYYCSKEGCLQDEYGCHIAIVKDLYDNFKLWTIQDAKDGDVLASELCDSIIIFSGIKDDNIDFYCDYDFSKIDIPGDRFTVNNGQHYGNVEDSKDFHPATKEHRELLFSKMKEARYEWDAKRKKLKKIDARENLTLDGDLMEADCMIAEQKPTWSEEDEKLFEYALDMVEWYDGTNREKSRTVSNWLKSIKVQKQWKPSKEQMDSLRGVINSLPHQQVLLTLYTDLKKLTE